MSDAKAVENLNPDHHQTIHEDVVHRHESERGDGHRGWETNGYDHFLQSHHHTLLSAHDEARLIGEVREGERAAAAHRELTGEALESRRLLRKVARGRSARHELITHNLRLVAGVVRRYNVSTTPGLDPDDLFQEGVLGLDRAIDLYDPQMSRFSTYATQWIRQKVGRAVDEQARTVRVPVYRCREHQRVWNVRERLSAGGVRPSVDDVAAAADLPVENVMRIDVEALSPVSLDRTTAHDRPLGDTLAADDEFTFDDELTTWVLITELFALLDSPREREVIIRRNGFAGQRETLGAIGDSFGVTRERTRQIEQRALDRIRSRLATLPEADRDAFRIWAE